MSRKGTFVISIDTELAWGRIADTELDSFLPLLKKTRQVILRILKLFELYQIPATWAIVGRLLLRDQDDLQLYSDLDHFYPDLSNQKIYSCAHLLEKNNPLIYGNDIFHWISNSSITHEIATHSFNHIRFDNLNDVQFAREDLRDVVKSSQNNHIEMKSIVFPSNGIAFTEILPEYGIKFYRGRDRYLYEKFPVWIKKIIYQFDTLLGCSPATVMPQKDSNGLIEIPGSIIFRVPHLGFKKHLPFASLVRKAKWGLYRACAKGEIFHLWFHPFNFAYREEDHLEALAEVLEESCKLRKEGDLRIKTMCEVGSEYLAEMNNDKDQNCS